MKKEEEAEGRHIGGEWEDRSKEGREEKTMKRVQTQGGERGEKQRKGRKHKEDRGGLPCSTADRKILYYAFLEILKLLIHMLYRDINKDRVSERGFQTSNAYKHAIIPMEGR